MTPCRSVIAGSGIGPSPNIPGNLLPPGPGRTVRRADNQREYNGQEEPNNGSGQERHYRGKLV
jgi:hypothetical protein